LCSRYNTYYTEIAHVRDIYLRRGYPGALLHNWIRQEARNRWDSRYENKKEALEGSPFWLKSVYNDVWKHVDLRKVWSAMEDTLNKAETPLAGYDSIRLSLKKFRNLGEINNAMNADEQRVFLSEEERVRQEMENSDSPAEDLDHNYQVHYRW
jgi:hypothetical protein